MARRIAAALLALTVMAPSGAVAAEEPEFGAMLVNVPLIVEHWDVPAVGVRNIGDVPVSAVVSIEGDGWGPTESTTPTIAPGERYDVTLTSIGTGRADVRATVTNTEPGMDRAIIVLESVARHVEWYETLPPWALLLLLIPGFGIMLIVRRRLTREERRAAERFQGLAEYGLLLALIAIVAIVALIFLGGQVSSQLSIVGETL